MATLVEMIEALSSFGLSQPEMAKRIGCDQSTISKVKTGKQETMKYEDGKNLEFLYKKMKSKKVA